MEMMDIKVKLNLNLSKMDKIYLNEKSSKLELKLEKKKKKREIRDNNNHHKQQQHQQTYNQSYTQENKCIRTGEPLKTPTGEPPKPPQESQLNPHRKKLFLKKSNSIKKN